MYFRIALLTTILFFAGCAPKPKVLAPQLPKTHLLPSNYEALNTWDEESYDELLGLFRKNCTSGKAKRLYGELCGEAEMTTDAASFFQRSFFPYKVVAKAGDESGLMTGYYEPLLYGSLEKSERYRYPVYGQPEDLLEIDLTSIFPELKGKRVRGKLVGNKVVPYEARGEMSEANAPVICWVDDKVSLFFLEVQGSGRIALDNGETLFVGYRNQNGHRYRSIGKYLIEQGEIEREKVSLQSIRKWLDENPERIDEVLNHNPSLVFFQSRSHGASGAMGLELTPGRSVAVDKRYIPLGSMLYVKANDPLEGTPLDRVVFAQDTGGAIKGELRADFFWGFGKEAEEKAGHMKAETEFWILLPKAENTLESAL